MPVPAARAFAGCSGNPSAASRPGPSPRSVSSCAAVAQHGVAAVGVRLRGQHLDLEHRAGPPRPPPAAAPRWPGRSRETRSARRETSGRFVAPTSRPVSIGPVELERGQGERRGGARPRPRRPAPGPRAIVVFSPGTRGAPPTLYSSASSTANHQAVPGTHGHGVAHGAGVEVGHRPRRAGPRRRLIGAVPQKSSRSRRASETVNVTTMAEPSAAAAAAMPVIRAGVSAAGCRRRRRRGRAGAADDDGSHAGVSASIVAIPVTACPVGRRPGPRAPFDTPGRFAYTRVMFVAVASEFAAEDHRRAAE